jgi:hypothetical protein
MSMEHFSAFYQQWFVNEQPEMRVGGSDFVAVQKVQIIKCAFSTRGRKYVK